MHALLKWCLGAQGQDAARRRMERPRSQAAAGGEDAEALRAYVVEQVDAMAGLRQDLEERIHSVAGAQVPLLLLLKPPPEHAQATIMRVRCQFRGQHQLHPLHHLLRISHIGVKL